MNKAALLCLPLAALMTSACSRSDTSTSQEQRRSALRAECPTDVSAPITVQGLGSRAVIERNPLRIRYEDASGATVLQQVANTLPSPYLPVNIPEPGAGNDMIQDQALYSPFTFEVGGAVNVQFPGTPWQGNLLLAGDAGIQYAATQLTQAHCNGNTAILTVATNDPTGRTLTLTLQPDESGLQALQVRATLTPSTGVVAIADSFDSGADEEFFGFGGRHNALSQRGRTFVNWVTQENFGAGPLQPGVDVIPGIGGKTYQFPNGETAAYYPQALFYSSRPYGFLLENSELARFKLAYSARPDAWQVSAAASELRYVVAPGNVQQKIKTLTGINGRHRVPPAWALGPTLLRGLKVLSADSDTADGYKTKVNADLDRVEKDPLPITSYSIEGWDFVSRNQLAGIVSRIRAKQYHPMMYIRAYAARDAGNTENPQYFTEALSNGYCGKLPLLNVCYVFGSPFLTGVALTIDYANPAAVNWWSDRVRLMLDLGADGFMQDFGENVMTDMVFANGETGLTMHNKYPAIYHATTRAVLDQYRIEHPDRAKQAGGAFYFFNRAGYSGRRSSATYENANFPGDNMTDWSRSNGLGSSISDMLNRGVGGAYGYTTDIGGYLDELTGAPTKELFIRWSQLAALSPIFRVHNSSTGGVHMPWDYDAETETIWTQMAQLHIKATPLILKLWAEAQTTGIPVTRPLWLAYPDDHEGYKQDQEFLLGSYVLVAPVTTQGATSRDVYFPTGCWQRPETGESFKGPAHISVSAPITSLPYFFRCGSKPF